MAPQTHNDRPYDVVVYGATGFTGRLIAEYLAGLADPSLRWAIAGRSPDKLEALKRDLQQASPACTELGVMCAESNDWATLVAMAQKAKVVLTTVGPYIKNGDRVVHACITGGADYVDITGEPEFVDLVIERYGDRAREAGVRIVSCCGFDSIPHDLGAFYTVGLLPAGAPIELEGFVRAKGTFSGGTWRTAVTAMGRLRDYRRSRAQAGGFQESSDRRVYSLKPRVRHDKTVGAWVFPMPTIDPSIVRRSARALERYGPAFGYAHYGTSQSLAKLALLGAGVGGMFALAQFGPTRQRLLDYRQSGDGPSAEQRADSWFTVTFVGKAGGERVVTRVSGGDPGYGETAKMASESAICLARDELPSRAGVLTPAVAMGQHLIDRLQAAGIRFEVVEG